MTDSPLVQDFATDFDHSDPQWVADPYPIWEDLRQRCPVASSPAVADSPVVAGSPAMASSPATASSPAIWS